MVYRIATMVFWRTLAITCVALGFIGVFVPGLPTVPFLLVAAWAGGKGWPALEAWLINHPRHGPAILRWRHHRAVPRQAKRLAVAMMTVSIVLIFLSNAPLVLKVGMILFIAGAGMWLWRRPEN